MDRYSERRWDAAGYEAIDAAVLEAIPFEYPGSGTVVEYVFPEFTSVCPWSGLPDFGTITITYIPGDKLVELKSLKYYLNSFRSVGILQEHVVNRIKDDLVKLLCPESLTVTGDFRPRGGISTRVSASYPGGARSGLPAHSL
ncbi:MAG: preQ(1) synthase [Clostridia bacterium]|jgi:7-cyano-7-deazaguanine reductase|nr:preQ(1) synthase [Clostridia bacterium]MDH7573586.1 preQ(1) synthase [Clostridia bacterium]